MTRPLKGTNSKFQCTRWILNSRALPFPRTRYGILLMLKRTITVNYTVTIIPRCLRHPSIPPVTNNHHCPLFMTTDECMLLWAYFDKYSLLMNYSNWGNHVNLLFFICYWTSLSFSREYLYCMTVCLFLQCTYTANLLVDGIIEVLKVFTFNDFPWSCFFCILTGFYAMNLVW